MAKQKAEEKLGTILEQPRKMTTGAFMLLFSSSPGWEREERERESDKHESEGKRAGGFMCTLCQDYAFFYLKTYW